MSDTTTDGIRIKIKPSYWSERSEPEHNQFAFTYTVTISNVGSEVAQLKSRYWVITDGDGRANASVRLPRSTRTWSPE